MRASFVIFSAIGLVAGRRRERYATERRICKSNRSKVLRETTKPSLGSPAWETLNGDRPLKPPARSQQIVNQTCLKPIPTRISLKTKQKNPSLQQGQKKKGEGKVLQSKRWKNKVRKAKRKVLELRSSQTISPTKRNGLSARKKVTLSISLIPISS